MSIDLSKLDRATVLAALFNHALQVWHSRIGVKVFPDMTIDEARVILNHQYQFSLLLGIEMGIDFSTSFVDTWSYDQIYGPGTGERVISELARST